MNNPNFENENSTLKLEKSKSKRYFRNIWTEEYGVIEHKEKVLCVLCNEFIVCRFYNIERHFKTVHKAIMLQTPEEMKEFISLKVKKFKNEEFTLLKFIKTPENLNMASYLIANLIAQRGRPLMDGEFIKQILIDVAPVIFEDMENVDKIIRRFENLSISRNTIKERIMEMGKDIEQQLFFDLKTYDYFSISLDETTDATSNARLAIISRYFDGHVIREELIKIETLPVKTTGVEICRVVTEVFENLKIDIKKIVSITTDGAQNMVGKNSGFKKLFTDNIGHPVVPFHCIIHQEVLCAKSGLSKLSEIMDTVTRIVNFIASRPLNKREFSSLLAEVESTFNGLLMFNNG